MANFENTPHKIRTTYEKIEKDQKDLIQKENDLSKIFKSKNYIKNNNLIYDSGEITIQPTFDLATRHTHKGTILPGYIVYNFRGEVEMPSTMLPFLDFETRFRVTPDRTLTSMPVYYTDQWELTFYELKGDGQQIWTGITPPTAPYQKVQQSQIDLGNVLQSHTQHAWKASVEWTQSGNQYRMLNVQLVGFESVHYDESSGCDSNTNFNIINGSLFYDSTMTLPYGKFVNITGNTITLRGQRNFIEYTDPGGGCTSSSTLTEDVEHTFDSSELTLYMYGVRQRFNGSNWVNDPNSLPAIRTAPAGTITSFSGESTGDFYAYWDSQKRFLFYIFTNTTPGIHFGEPVLGNLPVTFAYPDTLLPYTTISFKVNPDPYPVELSKRVVQRDDSSTYIRGEQPNILQNNGNKPVYFRISKSQEVEKYQVYLSYSSAILASANTVQSNTLPRFWNDTYTQSGTTYTVATTDHATKDRFLYHPSSDDMFTQVRIMLKNPFYWKETKKFRTEET